MVSSCLALLVVVILVVVPLRTHAGEANVTVSPFVGRWTAEVIDHCSGKLLANVTLDITPAEDELLEERSSTDVPHVQRFIAREVQDGGEAEEGTAGDAVERNTNPVEQLQAELRQQARNAYRAKLGFTVAVLANDDHENNNDAAVSQREASTTEDVEGRGPLPSSEEEGHHNVRRRLEVRIDGDAVPESLPALVFGPPRDAGLGVSVRTSDVRQTASATWTSTNGTSIVISVPGSRDKLASKACALASSPSSTRRRGGRRVAAATEDSALGGSQAVSLARTVVVLRKVQVPVVHWYQQPWVFIAFAVGMFWFKLVTSFKSAQEKVAPAADVAAGSRSRPAASVVHKR